MTTDFDGAGLTVFLAGIIQGSSPDGVFDQGYRNPIRSAVADALPAAEIFDPVAHYPDSLAYDDDAGRAAFFDLMERAGRADVLVAFLPEASMGTAIEIWNAYHAGRVVVAIGPLRENWVLRFMADHVCESVEEFAAWCADDGLSRLVRESHGRAAPHGAPSDRLGKETP